VTEVLLGVVHKRRPQSGKRGFVKCGHVVDKGEEGFFRCGRLHFLAQKTSDFSKFVVCHLLYYSILMVKIIVIDC